ncbi:MAG: hypothetical protein ACOCM4_11975, partial [Acetivibrio ethanolgignens]
TALFVCSESDTSLMNYNTTLVTLHSLSSKKLNYHEKHYIAIAQQSHSFKKEDIESRAKENLSVIGDVYRYE